MAEFKLTIADPKSGKAYQKEVKDNAAGVFIGLNIGETIKGDSFDMPGYEFQITGGSDYCGFPMRRGILGIRKKIVLAGGVGFNPKEKNLHRRKTVCGHKINENIVQINLKVAKEGSRKIEEIFPSKEGEKKEEKKPEKKEEKKEKPKEEKKEEKPQPKKEEKPKKEEPKEKSH